MRQIKKCSCGGGPLSHVWHLAEGLVEMCEECSDRRLAVARQAIRHRMQKETLPDVRFDFRIVEHGYQLDVYHDRGRTLYGDRVLTLFGGECRDFAGNHSIKNLCTSLTAALLVQVGRWQSDPVRGTGKKKPAVVRIHVNQHVIRSNQKTGARDPVLTVKRGKSNTRANEVELTGPSKVVYRPDEPLACGAKVWLETTCPVGIVDGKTKKIRPR